MEDNIIILPIDDYNFKYHKKYLEKLKESLEPFGIYLDKVQLIETNKGTSFTVYSTGPFVENFKEFSLESESPVIWKKIASKGFGAHNFLYIGKTKIKLNEWFNYSFEYRAQLLNPIIH